MSIQVVLDLEDLVNLLTYNKLFDHISLVDFPHIASLIEAADSGQVICYVDKSQENHPILYTREGWVNEKRRVLRTEEIGKEFAVRQEKKKQELSANLQTGMTTEKKALYKEMREAILANDFKKVLELKLKLK